jgi:spore germination protein YaaH
MMYMAYDEHVAGSKVAGSVGSYNWVENGIKDILAEGVPAEKLVLSVPFYLRDYTVTDASSSSTSEVTVARSSKLYSQPSIDEMFNLQDVSAGEKLKYMSTSGNFYVVDLNGNPAYINKNDATLTPGTGISKSYSVIKSETLSLQGGFDRVNNYGGSIYYDESDRQSVGKYTKDGQTHVVWLETKDSMAWRMDLIEKYGLRGTAAWQLYNETPDMWEVIKEKLKQ